MLRMISASFLIAFTCAIVTAASAASSTAGTIDQPTKSSPPPRVTSPPPQSYNGALTSAKSVGSQSVPQNSGGRPITTDRPNVYNGGSVAGPQKRVEGQN